MENIRKQRMHVIDAHIVKIMKARKTYPMNKVHEEVVNNITTFVPTEKDVKQ